VWTCLAHFILLLTVFYSSLLLPFFLSLFFFFLLCVGSTKFSLYACDSISNFKLQRVRIMGYTGVDGFFFFFNISKGGKWCLSGFRYIVYFFYIIAFSSHSLFRLIYIATPLVFSERSDLLPSNEKKNPKVLFYLSLFFSFSFDLG
jgi:hypothetical protein